MMLTYTDGAYLPLPARDGLRSLNADLHAELRQVRRLLRSANMRCLRCADLLARTRAGHDEAVQLAQAMQTALHQQQAEYASAVAGWKATMEMLAATARSLEQTTAEVRRMRQEAGR